MTKRTNIKEALIGGWLHQIYTGLNSLFVIVGTKVIKPIILAFRSIGDRFDLGKASLSDWFFRVIKPLNKLLLL